MGVKFDERELKELIISIERKRNASEEDIRKLRCLRCGLLGEIHKKQQLLDKADFIICKFKKERD